MLIKWTTSSIALLGVFSIIWGTSSAYKIGVGRADCTGPPVEIGFMGYAQLGQKGEGIHLRQFSRAFIIQDDDKRVVFVSVDAAMMGHSVKRDVISLLQQKYGRNYTLQNVVISGTHTHSTPGGFLMHLLYDISILGYVPETFNALVEGIATSIERAHENIEEGRIFISTGEVKDANINRSPTSYLHNPAEEREQYDGDTDRTLKQMRFVSQDGSRILGAINWFAVHPTSMNHSNHLISTDNMGYASILLEQEHNPGSMTGQGKFVGAFASSNLGDVSPNIMGPKCHLSGNPCDVLTSSCPKSEGQCIATGPGKDMFESTKIIATRIYSTASDLLKKTGAMEVSGPIGFIHQFVDMPEQRVKAFNPLTRNVEEVQGCVPAMGYSFAAGTTDGAGSFHFEQGMTTDNILWNTVRDFLAPPTKEDVNCHFPKPILLATGRAQFPYEWQPRVVSTQVLQIGNVLIAAVPGEFTTMSGRRMVTNLQIGARTGGHSDTFVILAGLSNVYSSYITTPEEYQAQRYEAASTIFGPQTLTIYLEQYKKLAAAVTSGGSLEPGPTPPFMDNKMLSLNPGVVYDGHPIGKDFGTVKSEPNQSYKIGDTVWSSFVAANPRNNLKHERSYFTVERQLADNPEEWAEVLTDAHWDTKFNWVRVSTILGFSELHVSWTIGDQTPPGTYRLKHYGHYKYILGGIYPYDGTTRPFTVSS